jgi:hypothetical protein
MQNNQRGRSITIAPFLVKRFVEWFPCEQRQPGCCAHWQTSAVTRG